MQISDLSIRRPVTTLTVMAAFVIFGVIAYSKMGIDQFPKTDLPFVTVTTILVGANPAVIDQEVTDILEEEINTINGIKTLLSKSYEGVSQIFIEFELEKNVDVAAEEVRAKVNIAKRKLPDGIEEPIVDKLDLGAAPVLNIAVFGSADYKDLAYYADKTLKNQLISVIGVGSVSLGGLRDRQIRVWINPEKLEAYGITPQEVIGAIKIKHVEMPGGRIETDKKEYSIKIEGEYPSADSLKKLAIAERNGAVIRLCDVGRVDDGFEDYRTVVEYNGQTAIGLEVRKQSGANTVQAAQAIKEKLAEISKQTPPGINVEIAFDASRFIEESIKGAGFDLIFGVILTALIMYLFLRNVRITFISVVSIPISLVGSFVAMNALNFTANFMTMMALSLAVGMVIDDAIVVLENIFRHVENGAEPMQAASKGTDEVGFAVIAATSSIAAVFIPVAFMKGIIGRMFYQFGMTIALSIVISLLVSLTLTPFLSSRLIKHRKSHNKLYVLLENFFVGLENVYRQVLGWAVNHRAVVVGLALAAFAGGLVMAKFIGNEFVTKADESRFQISAELPTGTSINQTVQRLREIQKIVLSQPEVKNVYSSIGTGANTEVNIASTIVVLIPKGERTVSQQQIMNRLRDKFAGFTDMIYSIENLNPLGQREVDLEYVIKGPTIEELAAVSGKIIEDLKKIDGFMDVDSNLRLTKPEVKIEINRKLADDLGVDARSISNEIYSLFGGVDAAQYNEGGYRYTIRVQGASDFRDLPDDLKKVVVRNRAGQIIKAENLFNYEIEEGPNVINRYNRGRAVTFYANLQGISQGVAMQKLEEIVQKHLPKNSGWSAVQSGMTKTKVETFGYLFQALLVAILVIYMVLAIQFESFIHPFTVMFSLPLTTVGVFGALLITGMTLNIFSMIGVIMLVGIVTRNSIMLVDFANQARNRGMDKVSAMLSAGPIRLRPILMTAIAMIIGVLPVALGRSEGGEMRAPMAVAVIGGMISSTFLTLLVIPAIYLLLDDAIEWVGKKG